MNSETPLISVVIIFLDAGNFIKEAIESVIGQTYQHWELLLVDDGSTDDGTEIALQFARDYPVKIRYYEHLGHRNQGMSASRYLGTQNAMGKYIAFIDADDVWLDTKLETQVAIMEENPEAVMSYGASLYWYSWTGNPDDKLDDFVLDVKVEPNTLIQPPGLISQFLSGKATVPCPSSTIFRSEALKKLEGPEYETIYEDQVMYVKTCLDAPVYVSSASLERYRQHPDSICSVAAQTGKLMDARLTYLNWLADYLVMQGVTDDEIWVTLRKQIWLIGHYKPNKHSPKDIRKYDAVRLIKKWLLRIEEHLLPASASKRLWNRNHDPLS